MASAFVLSQNVQRKDIVIFLCPTTRINWIKTVIKARPFFRSVGAFHVSRPLKWFISYVFLLIRRRYSKFYCIASRGHEIRWGRVWFVSYELSLPHNAYVDKTFKLVGEPGIKRRWNDVSASNETIDDSLVICLTVYILGLLIYS